MTVLLFAAAHAIPLILAVALTRNATTLNLVAVVTLVFAIAVGDPTYVLLDVGVVAITYAACSSMLEPKPAPDSRHPQQVKSQPMKDGKRTRYGLDDEEKAQRRRLIESILRFKGVFESSVEEAALTLGLREPPSRGDKFLAILVGAAEGLAIKAQASRNVSYSAKKVVWLIELKIQGARADHGRPHFRQFSQDPNLAPWFHLAKYSVTEEEEGHKYVFLAFEYVKGGGG